MIGLIAQIPPPPVGWSDFIERHGLPTLLCVGMGIVLWRVVVFLLKTHREERTEMAGRMDAFHSEHREERREWSAWANRMHDEQMAAHQETQGVIRDLHETIRREKS